MSDDKNNRGRPDSDLVSLKQEHEVRYWTGKWQVSKNVLQVAIDATGSHHKTKIEKWLEDNGHITCDE